jgi:hypothetical protein
MSTPEQPDAIEPAPPKRAARGAAKAPEATPAVDETSAAPVSDGAETSDDTAATDNSEATENAEGASVEPEKRRRGRPKGSTARTTRTIELTLTVSGTVDGDWQAELKQGSTWLSRGLPVTAAAVLKAAHELHPELAEPIDAAIGAARETALEAELEQARKALAEIEG